MNVTDDGRYGLAAATGGAGVKPFVERTVGDEGIQVAIVGITDPRVPSYEPPGNVVGLTFSDPIAAAQPQADAVRARKDDVLIALTHIGFTTNPGSVEADGNVDTNLAARASAARGRPRTASHELGASPPRRPPSVPPPAVRAPRFPAAPLRTRPPSRSRARRPRREQAQVPAVRRARPPGSR